MSVGPASEEQPRHHSLLKASLQISLYCIKSGNSISEDGLTWSPLPNLFCHECEGGEKLHHYLHDYLSHSRCRRDFGVNVEAFQEVLYGLEQFDDNIQVGTDALERLR